MCVLVVDGANVVGSRPDGWWRDRPGAARRLHDQLCRADVAHRQLILVLEGNAVAGQPVGSVGAVRTVHAPASGDDEIVRQVEDLRRAGRQVDVVTADRGLRRRVEAAGGSCLGPSWLLGRCGGSV